MITLPRLLICENPITGASGCTGCASSATHLRIGFFFDGTGNNLFNTAYGLRRVASGDASFRHSRGSFSNGLTNVANLYSMYRSGCEVTPDRTTLYLREYFDGVGTRRARRQNNGRHAAPPDTSFGQSMGTGTTGCLAQAHKACRKLYEILKGQARSFEDVTIDVFGFSRGAATARHFMNCVNLGGFFGHANRAAERGSPPTPPSYEAGGTSPHEDPIRLAGLLGVSPALIIDRALEDILANATIAAPIVHALNLIRRLREEVHLPITKSGGQVEILPGLTIGDLYTAIDVDFRVLRAAPKIGFAGLFDTVSSISEFGETVAHGFDPSAVRNDDNGPLNIHLGPQSAEHVYHITAADEFRPNFSLSSALPSTTSTVGRFGTIDQISFPGSHADVGGSYQYEGEVVVPILPIDHDLDDTLHFSGANASSAAARACRHRSLPSLFTNLQRTKEAFQQSALYTRYAGADDSLTLLRVGQESRTQSAQRDQFGPTGEFVVYVSGHLKAGIVWNRPSLKTTLQNVTCKLMAKKARQHGVPFRQQDIDGIPIPGQELQQLYSAYSTGGVWDSDQLDSSLLSNIRKSYVHFSAKYYWRAMSIVNAPDGFPSDLKALNIFHDAVLVLPRSRGRSYTISLPKIFWPSEPLNPGPEFDASATLHDARRPDGGVPWESARIVHGNQPTLSPQAQSGV